jgi:nucleotidyltransferase substrate binding protein (TIGR01987 family)
VQDPDRDRFELARQQFGKALARLHEALALDETSIVRDALIQRFEFTFELAWKAMHYWLITEGEAVPPITGATLRMALLAGLINDAEVWQRVRDHRNATSHTYNEAKAVEVAAFVRTGAVAAFDALAAKLAQL